jgi:hypothetical protein
MASPLVSLLAGSLPCGPAGQAGGHAHGLRHVYADASSPQILVDGWVAPDVTVRSGRAVEFARSAHFSTRTATDVTEPVRSYRKMSKGGRMLKELLL